MNLHSTSRVRGRDWRPYGVRIDATEKAVVAAGGKVLMERSVIVGVGTLMWFQDPEGNAFGAMQYDKKAE